MFGVDTNDASVVNKDMVEAEPEEEEEKVMPIDLYCAH